MLDILILLPDTANWAT